MLGMNPMNRSSDADRKFARDMIKHHEMAVTMSRGILIIGKHPMIRRMATEIIGAQEKEIARFKAFLNSGR